MEKLPMIGVMLGDATGIGLKIAAEVLASGKLTLEHALRLAARLATARLKARSAAPAA